MIFDNPQQEAEHANGMISLQIEQNEEYIQTCLLSLKEAKKKLRKLNKQLTCEHNFNLKQIGFSDNYKCKKCKFEFS